MTEETVVVESDTKIDHLEPIKDMANKVGIKIPKLKAEGNLLVVNPKEETMVLKDKETLVIEDAAKKKEAVPVKKKDIILPQLGKVFMFEGNEYKVVYINEGQHRFTCEPYKGDY